MASQANDKLAAANEPAGALQVGGAGGKRLVFGLSSHTNRVRHDEYAQRRSRPARDKAPASQSVQPATSESGCQPARASVPEAQPRGPASAAAGNRCREPARGKVRASAYGNFYRPSSASEAPASQPDSMEPQQEAKRVSSQPAPAKAVGANSQPAANEPVISQSGSSRRQFTIPPPPKQRSLATLGATGKRSVVSYAKSRIYDQKGGQQGKALLLEEAGKIPQSILSGFKPPKQVNVSKAREKWEGGEPFAKCKSRQRLQAAQAGKRLQMQGAWCMASVVATQQLQLARAGLDVGSAGQQQSGRVSGSAGADQMKILTRGSVLERAQKFEKVPEREGAQMQPAEPAGHQQALSTSSASSTSLPAQPGSLSDPSNLSGQLEGQNRLNLLARRLSNSSSSSIPKFYHPNGKPNTYELELQKRNIVAAFEKLPERKAQLEGPTCRRHFHAIALACGFSEYFKDPLLLYVKHQLHESSLLLSVGNKQRPSLLAQQLIQTNQMPSNGTTNQRAPDESSIKAKTATTANQLIRATSIDNSTMEKLQSQNYVSCDQFLVCWRNLISSAFDTTARFVHLLTFGRRNHLLPGDFVPLIQSVIEDHPGLKFLRAAPDFHMRYIQTVVARIYFSINKSWTGKLSLAELYKSNLMDVLQKLSKEQDINQVREYFSYEHFYVIYCKFWSLDQDHDLLISKEDLARHNDAAISSRIIERIFMGIVSRDVQKTGKMSYSDFVWFLIAEEDKKHPRSIEYWFRLMDIDGDGYISLYEMEYFYYEQTKRLELMNIEALPFLDCACQILDLVNPKERNKISLSDLKRTKMAPIFFDTFINLEKYLEHESHEFVSSRDVTLDGKVISDWDRYASEEYESLVTEEIAV